MDVKSGIDYGVSPPRKYRVIMMTEDGETVEKVVTLPITLANNPATVSAWYQKYVPAGHLLVEVEPAEAGEDDEETVLGEALQGLHAERESEEHVGFGDSLDFTGEEPIEEDEKSEEDDNGESFVSFEPVTPPDSDV